MRIGILSGTFDPIHIGHIESALVSLAACELDEVLVMIEKKPHRKSKTTDYKARKKMVELALADFQKINLCDVSEDNITFEKTGKELQAEHKDAQFVMIMGSDMLEHLSEWPGLEDWLTEHELCVVLRENKEKAATEKKLKQLREEHPKLKAKTVPAVWSPVSSAQIKKDLKKHGGSELVHRKVMDYIKANNVYDLSASK